MPSPSEILDSLSHIANRWVGVAVFWHALLAVALLGVARGVWRPSSRVAAWATSTPLASAALFAGLGGNVFNAALLSLTTAGLGVLALRTPDVELQLAPLRIRWAGAAMVAFAWLYPHFLEAESLWMYAVASPLGLIPCPSLSLVVGLALYSNAFGSRAWGLTASAVGLFYGVYGVARLGVWTDLPLIAGAGLLLVTSARRTRARPTPHLRRASSLAN